MLAFHQDAVLYDIVECNMLLCAAGPNGGKQTVWDSGYWSFASPGKTLGEVVIGRVQRAGTSWADWERGREWTEHAPGSYPFTWSLCFPLA